MNNSVGLDLNAGLCLTGILIHLMAKLPGNHVHGVTVTVKIFVTYQRKHLYSWFSRYIFVCLEGLRVNLRTISIIVSVTYFAY